MNNPNPVRLAIIGAGSRGRAYADYVLRHPHAAQVVAVAEPRGLFRERLAQEHGIASTHVFEHWQDLLAQPKLADAVVIATPDALHAEPAIVCAKVGYHMLLEKPMAPNAEDCKRIVAAANDANIMLAVCHVMRYTPYTQALKQLLNAGAVGDIVSVQHLEPVGFWHQAHSFVRGNWRNEHESSPMLLAKSCHDLDWLRYVVGAPCKRVSSFGNLKHFRASQKPEGASERCLDCAVEHECAYSAKRFYLEALHNGDHGWPLAVVTQDFTEHGVTTALREGPYGRCVYACDNDVVDHQVVNLEFENGVTASFTMTAFTESRARETRIFGTRGELYGDGQHIRVYDFLTRTTHHTDTNLSSDGGILSGHGGGDDATIAAFVAAIAENNPAKILSGAAESLETHLMVFAAETARLEGSVVDVQV